ncbi:uncharacterized protein [Argopecten irradians]|uniref:uncharacterized protein n=1 Tax=Argopecten irradians TaxID=31199 RepID=UPI0037172925
MMLFWSYVKCKYLDVQQARTVSMTVNGNFHCPQTCNGGNCNSSTGACFYCFSGTYNDYCAEACPDNCKDSVCERKFGNCFDCNPGWYGDRCYQGCSQNCSGMSCERTTGNCFGK